MKFVSAQTIDSEKLWKFKIMQFLMKISVQIFQSKKQECFNNNIQRLYFSSLYFLQFVFEQYAGSKYQAKKFLPQKQLNQKYI